jgi:uncharacterized Zn finger protein
MASVADVVEPAAVERLVAPDELAAGRALARGGDVSFDEFGPLRVLSKVADGGGVAEVELTSAGGTLGWSCTCAEGASGRICRHVAATAFETWEKSPKRR